MYLVWFVIWMIYNFCDLKNFFNIPWIWHYFNSALVFPAYYFKILLRVVKRKKARMSCKAAYIKPFPKYFSVTLNREVFKMGKKFVKFHTRVWFPPPPSWCQCGKSQPIFFKLLSWFWATLEKKIVEFSTLREAFKKVLKIQH